MRALFLITFSILISLLIAVGSPAFALDFPADEESCPTVDVRADYNLGNVRNQKSLGWCYAYAIADIVSFKLRRDVSPFDIAFTTVQYYINEEKLTPLNITSVEGGSVPIVSKAISDRGICDSKKFSASNPLAVDSLVAVEANVKKLVDGLSEGKISEIGVRKELAARVQDYNTVFPTSSQEELLNAILNDRNYKYPIAGMVDNICVDRASGKFAWGWEMRDDFAEDMKFRSIRGILASHFPVAINYSSEVLKDVNATSVGGHASTIVGMHFNQQKKRCEYLLRNSWGVADPQRVYDPELRPMIAQGYVWIAEDVLRKNIAAAYWIY